MDITVTFRHTDPIESLKSYAEEKISKIKKYIDVPLEAHIVLSVEKFRHIADVTLSLNGTRIKAVEETDDMYSAIDQVMDVSPQVLPFSDQRQDIYTLLCYLHPTDTNQVSCPRSGVFQYLLVLSPYWLCSNLH